MTCWTCGPRESDKCLCKSSRAAEIGRALREARVAAEVQRRLDIAERFGATDPLDNGAVLTFPVTYDNGRTYHYAALRTGGRWYLTGGKACQGVTWLELVEWWVSRDIPVTPGQVTVCLGEAVSLTGFLAERA